MRLFEKLKNKDTYKFDDNPNVAVIVCCHVLSGEESVMYVSHDMDDGMWQFLCNKSHTTDDAKIASLQEVLDLDNSINALGHMKCGYFATRNSGNDHWNIRKR